MKKKYSEDLPLKNLLEDGPVTILKVDNDQFLLEIVRDIESQNHTILKAGNMNSILNNIHHEPAEAIELEYAIEDIEDQLMPIIKDLPDNRCLLTSEQLFLDIANVAELDLDDNRQLDIETVEEVFNRLADVAWGTPATRLKMPENREFAATVLFLRELMHHADYDSMAFF